MTHVKLVNDWETHLALVVNKELCSLEYHPPFLPNPGGILAIAGEQARSALFRKLEQDALRIMVGVVEMAAWRGELNVVVPQL